MRRALRDVVGCLGLFGLLCCAHAPPGPPAPPPEPQLPLPRSSIAAILLHRGDLDLTDAQVSRLQERDDALEKAQADLRADAAKQQSAKTQPQGLSPQMQSPGGGGRHRGQARAAADPPPKRASFEDLMNDNDTRAYLEAEAAVLTEKQRDPAREIASQYRADLYDRREQERAKHEN